MHRATCTYDQQPSPAPNGRSPRRANTRAEVSCDAAIPAPREILRQTADALERMLQAPDSRPEWFIG